MGLVLGWYSRENLKEKLWWVGGLASDAAVEAAECLAAWKSSVAERVMPFVMGVSERWLLFGAGGAEAVLMALADLLGGPRDRDRLLEERRFLKKPPMPRPRGSASESEWSRDESGRKSPSLNCEIIDARFEIPAGGLDSGAMMPSNDINASLGLSCGSVLTIHNRLLGAGLHGCVEGGTSPFRSASSRKCR